MAIVVISALALWAWLPVPASSQDESTLRGRIERSRDQERSLSGAVAGSTRCSRARSARSRSCKGA